MTAFLVCVTQHNPDPYFGKPYIYVIELLITLVEMHTLTAVYFCSGICFKRLILVLKIIQVIKY